MRADPLDVQAEPDESERPEIECLCGDIMESVEAMHEHIHLSHPEADHDDEDRLRKTARKLVKGWFGAGFDPGLFHELRAALEETPDES